MSQGNTYFLITSHILMSFFCVLGLLVWPTLTCFHLEKKTTKGILKNKMSKLVGVSFFQNAPWNFTLYKHTYKYTKKNLKCFYILMSKVNVLSQMFHHIRAFSHILFGWTSNIKHKLFPPPFTGGFHFNLYIKNLAIFSPKKNQIYARKN
jgi:hypothetical protein